MANHVSALKRARQTVKRTGVNRSNKSHVRKSLRALREGAIEIYNVPSPPAAEKTDTAAAPKK